MCMSVSGPAWPFAGPGSKISRGLNTHSNPTVKFYNEELFIYKCSTYYIFFKRIILNNNPCHASRDWRTLSIEDHSNKIAWCVFVENINEPHDGNWHTTTKKWQALLCPVPMQVCRSCDWSTDFQKLGSLISIFTLSYRVWSNISKTAETILIKKIGRSHGISVYKNTLINEHRKIIFFEIITVLSKCLVVS